MTPKKLTKTLQNKSVRSISPIKPISHFDRMHNEHKPKSNYIPVERYEFVQTQSVNETTGRVSYKTEKRLVKKDKFTAFKVSDFCLENLQVIGAVDKLKHTTISPDAHSAIKSAENGILKMSSTQNDN